MLKYLFFSVVFALFNFFWFETFQMHKPTRSFVLPALVIALCILFQIFSHPYKDIHKSDLSCFILWIKFNMNSLN